LASRPRSYKKGGEQKKVKKFNWQCFSAAQYQKRGTTTNKNDIAAVETDLVCRTTRHVCDDLTVC
jgi:hypothetical protein